jgi:colanic acid biosynthesis protein WcaH
MRSVLFLRDFLTRAGVKGSKAASPPGGKLPDSDFLHLIRTAPLVAVDVVLKDGAGQVLLVQRNDEPARGYYFVPGGRIFKNERIAAAFQRIVMAELGLSVSFRSAVLLGLYQHIYDTNRFQEEGTGTHYVVLAYEAVLPERPVLAVDALYRWAAPQDIPAMVDVHPFTKAYFSEDFRHLTAAAGGLSA